MSHTTDGIADSRQMLLSGGRTSWPPSRKHGIMSKIRSYTHIYLKNNPAKFHPDPIWN